jgi:hypothetical protein
MDPGEEKEGNSHGFFSALMDEHRRLRDEARKSVFMCTTDTGGEATGKVAVLCKDLAEAIMHCNRLATFDGSPLFKMMKSFDKDCDKVKAFAKALLHEIHNHARCSGESRSTFEIAVCFNATKKTWTLQIVKNIIKKLRKIAGMPVSLDDVANPDKTFMEYPATPVIAEVHINPPGPSLTLHIPDRTLTTIHFACKNMGYTIVSGDTEKQCVRFMDMHIWARGQVRSHQYIHTHTHTCATCNHGSCFFFLRHCIHTPD